MQLNKGRQCSTGRLTDGRDGAGGGAGCRARVGGGEGEREEKMESPCNMHYFHYGFIQGCLLVPLTFFLRLIIDL